jgi:hypothetical protein
MRKTKKHSKEMRCKILKLMRLLKNCSVKLMFEEGPVVDFFGHSDEPLLDK